MVSIQIDDEQLVLRLQQLAKRENRPVEAVLQTLLDQYVLRDESLDAMDGIFDDDITDLSTSIRDTMTSYYQKRNDDSR
jgi:hypothetical protein